MSVVMRVLHVTNLGEPGSPAWVKTFSIEAHEGRGEVDYTHNIKEAYVWPDFLTAMEDWRAVSKVRPVRDDGLPNRPLTALTIEIEPAP